jgi:hypothetical protein
MLGSLYSQHPKCYVLHIGRKGRLTQKRGSFRRRFSNIPHRNAPAFALAAHELPAAQVLIDVAPYPRPITALRRPNLHPLSTFRSFSGVTYAFPKQSFTAPNSARPARSALRDLRGGDTIANEQIAALQTNPIRRTTSAEGRCPNVRHPRRTRTVRRILRLQ